MPFPTTGVSAALGRDGYLIVDSMFGALTADALRVETVARYATGAYSKASVGARHTHAQRDEVREDETCWLDDEVGALGAFVTSTNAWRGELNRQCYLGLSRSECHLARYGVGAHYSAHIDTFADSSARAISFVYFMNPTWTAGAGGLLRLSGIHALDVQPLHDRAIFFLSKEVEHEVTEVFAERWTLTGWMSTRATTSGR